MMASDDEKGSEDYNEEGEEEYYDPEEDELDSEEEAKAEAHAEMLARRMREQLQAEIEKAYAIPPEDPIVSTIKLILQAAESNDRIRVTLDAIHFTRDHSVYGILKESLEAGGVSDTYTGKLASLLEALADGTTLNEIEPLDAINGKRPLDTDRSVPDQPTKRPRLTPSPLSDHHVKFNTLIKEAVDKTSAVLDSTTKSPLDRSQVLSIQVPLHRIFLFSSTAAKATGVPVLHQVGGLAQVLGALHAVQITPVVNSDLSTAVFTCPPCKKSFSALSYLRTHESHMHNSSRPFKCDQCCIGFETLSSSNDHSRAVHGGMKPTLLQYTCDSCHQNFPDRDAIRNHQNDPCSYPSCADGVIRVIESLAGTPFLEAGELPQTILTEAQASVLRLHAQLQERVEQLLDHSVPGKAKRNIGGRVGGWQALGLIVSQCVDPNHTLPPPLSNASALPLQLVQYGLSEVQASAVNKAIKEACATVKEASFAEAGIEEAKPRIDGEEDEEVNVVDDEE
ncbi:uncharacterized protein EI90DRAFT_3037963 [Cantharellus anzutake]|uniref:uncharacterized protein n=1 Tax=Cantharellus anzutake TaxID=1750568 RepID=UPI00190458EE|nr:uncharacterized protein EI90DRAFT_3037963 [Cantharellus anzutake]KAF8339843.1 hypothetical protein EI90DRAFT_3037963 [Cantharellus anzutake]